MSHAIRTAIAVFAALASISSPAVADGGNVDHRPCVTVPEFYRMPATDKAELERFIDTRGQIVYRSIEGQIKHYEFCDHPHGWLAVSYLASKRGGMRVDGMMLIRWCKSKHGDGPWVWCDPSVPSIAEGLWLRGSALAIDRQRFAASTVRAGVGGK